MRTLQVPVLDCVPPLLPLLPQDGLHGAVRLEGDGRAEDPSAVPANEGGEVCAYYYIRLSPTHSLQSWALAVFWLVFFFK